MPVSDIAPGFLRITYGLPTSQHVMIVPVNPVPETVVVGQEPSFLTRGGIQLDMEIAWDTLSGYLAPMFTAAVSFTSVEFWSRPTPEDDPIFVYALPGGLPGTGVGTLAVDGMLTITFRTFAGGIRKFVLMESIFPSNFIDQEPWSNAAMEDFITYIESANNFTYSRDNSYPFIGLKALGKTSDALRKRRLNL